MNPLASAAPYQISPPQLVASAPQKYPFAESKVFSIGNVPDHLRYNTLQLSQKLQQIVFQIAKTIKENKDVCTLSEAITKEEGSQVLMALDLDFPELVYHGLIQKLTNGKLTGVQVSLMPVTDFIHHNAKIDAIIRGIKTTAGMNSDWAKAKVIYETVVGTVTFVNDQNTSTCSRCCLSTGLGTIFGIAKAFHYLCNMLEVTCISAKAMQQEKFTQIFNCVLINKKWSNIDCGIGIQMRKKELTYGYFCFPDKWLREMKILSQKPTCTSLENTYYYVEGGLIISQNQQDTMSRVAANQLYQGKTFADYMFLTPNPADDFKALVAATTWGIHRYTQKTQIDTMHQSMDLYCNVPVFRLNFSQLETRYHVFSQEIAICSPQVIAAVGVEFSKMINSNIRTIFFVFQSNTDYESISKQFLDHFGKIISEAKKHDMVEDIGNFSYAGDASAKIMQITV
ncbi:Transglutaminase/protease-like domain-containing protein [Spironucleus salmonicida]|uniref:Transglutaminase/protease-like domain-containing protein n=1 Tax=Spironucleus salmonicida TaxID=348837 RepID=V6LW09_9EUKA|nr:Transglutaminase/protease-like domain-containing protein [Spironucleus salmonicida]|eukprot:EST45004.1 Transglutaminase/protease-like domain-containing protein [Spironucleus salmonicida]